MSTLRCAHCGLVNFSTATQCKRCRTPFVQDLSPVGGANVHGIVLEDGYVLPPPPSVGTPGAGLWRDKDQLVVSNGMPLPDRCIKCNAPAPGPKLKKKLSWHHPAFYFLILAGVLIYAIAVMFVRKNAIIHLGLCEEHMMKHRRSVLVNWLFILLVVGFFVLALITWNNYFIIPVMMLLPAGVLYALIAGRTVTAAKIDNKFAWLKGVNGAYLDGVPPLPRA